MKPISLAFDAKRAFHNSTGLGNYSRFVLSGLAEQFPSEKYALMSPEKASLFLKRSKLLEEVLPQGLGQLSPSFWRSFSMSEQLKKMGAQLFHGLSHELPTGLRKNGIASVVTIHDIIFESHPQYYNPIDRLTYAWKFKKAALNADLVFSVSEYTSKQLQERYQIPENKIQVHYQSCHPAFYTANKSSPEPIFKLPSNYLLSVGTIEERKNLLHILKAIQNLDIPLVVVGRGKKYLEKCHAFIQQNKMESRVHFIERIEIDQLVQVYQKASAFVYPSRIEGFGIPIIEALFSKCPVITTHGGVFSEAGGPSSYYVNPESSDSIREGILLALNTSDREEKIAAGLKYAQENFLPKPLIQNIMQSYRSLL